MARNARDALVGLIGGIADVDWVLAQLDRAGWEIVDKLPTDRPDPVHCCNGCPHPDHGGEFPS